MGISINYGSSLSYLNSDKTYQNDPNDTNLTSDDQNLVKWAKGLAQNQDNGGFHVQNNFNNYDAWNHLKPETRDAINNWSNVLQTGTPDQKALAREQLKYYLAQGVSQLQNDKGGINGDVRSKVQHDRATAPGDLNGLEVLQDLGALNGVSSFDGSFDPSKYNASITVPTADPSTSILVGNPAALLTGDNDPTKVAEAVVKLISSQDSDEQKVGAQLQEVFNAYNNRLKSGADVKSDVLLNAGAQQILDIMNAVRGDSSLSGNSPSTSTDSPKSESTKAPSATEPGNSQSTTPSSYTVASSDADGLWGIAKRQLQSALGGEPSIAQVSAYWNQVITANTNGNGANLANPNVIYVGQALTLPPVPGASSSASTSGSASSSSSPSVQNKGTVRFV